MQFLHDNLSQFFEDRDGAGRFQEDAWLRPGGGGGVSRVLTEGATFEKAGVNRFAGGGSIPAELAARLGSSRFLTETVDFFATGVSVVCHPRSPLIPIVHMNVRYFELRDGSGRRVDHWFGRGLDLTPTYPFPEDAVHFHQMLRRICNRHLPWGAREKDFQLVRRGRYAEFNLVHDRGTRFGLQTNARIESVLMSMPPVARWGYALSYEEGTFEQRLMAMLEPRDWARGAPDSLSTPVR